MTSQSKGGGSRHHIPAWHTERPEPERRRLVDAAKRLTPVELAIRITEALRRRAGG